MRSHSGQSDVLRIEASNRIADIRAALRFAQIAPIEQESIGKTIVIRMDRTTNTLQNALLRGIEEPPNNAQFVLSAADRTNILPTILSRCHITEHRADGYGASLSDLTAAGMTVQRAASVASQLSRGYHVNEVPTEQDESMAKSLIQAGIAKDAELGVSISQSFERRTVTALRSILVQQGMIAALKASYQSNYPESSANLALFWIMQNA